MDVSMLSQRQIRNLTVIVLVFFVVPVVVFLILSSQWSPRALERELSNRKLLSVLAHAGADHLSENPGDGAPEVIEAGKSAIRSAGEWEGQIFAIGVEDAWGSWLRLSELQSEPEPVYEWRSVGKDGLLNTKDDRASRFRAGEVLLDPVLESK